MPIKLLVVDDSQPIRDSLRGLLGRILSGAHIQEAVTLAQALHCARLDPPQLVILDLHLPDGLATEIIAPLRQLSPGLCIAVLTIHADAAYRHKCLSLGANWFFDKATEFENLLDVVRSEVQLHWVKASEQRKDLLSQGAACVQRNHLDPLPIDHQAPDLISNPSRKEP
jgi:DNA-binding NarL/FixJ family response regulator